MIYYSKSIGGFLHSKVHDIPGDAVEITPERHKELLEGQAIGKLISVNAQGKPDLIDHPEAASIPTCTPYQFHEALNLMGLTDAVNAAAAQNRSIQNALQFAPEFKRNHPKITEMAQAIGKTDADIDTLFALAATLAP